MDLRIPEYMSTITRLVKTPGSTLNEIWITGVWMLGCAAGAMLLTFISGFVTSMLAATFSRNLRRSTNDVAQMRFVNNGLNVGIYCVGAFLIANSIGTGSDIATFSNS